MSVYFHGSFGLNREYMSAIVLHGLKNKKAVDSDFGHLFGYGAPFGAKYRSWLYYTGLVEKGLPIKLTAIGKVVMSKDPKLERTVTKWVLHNELTTDPIRAEAWHFFIKDFLPQRSSFTREDLLMGLAMKLGPHNKKHFGMDSKLNPVIARKQIECYTEEHGLGSLGFLKKDGQDRYIVLKPKVRRPWTVGQLEKAYV